MSQFQFSPGRNIAENICSEIHAQTKSFTTTNVSISSRGNKLYLDPNQNDYADTVAAPYSARPYHLPTVSTPLQWNELASKLDPTNFTIHTIKKRLAQKGDLFKEVINEKLAKANSKILKNFLE